MSRQFTVRIKHEPGALAALAEALAERDIDIRAVGAAVVGANGVVVFTTNNDSAAREVLREAKYTFAEGEIVTVYVEDYPGSLARTTRSLADAGVNIQGLLVMGRREGKAQLAVTVDDIAKAKRALGVV
jgi:hypothetical protein